MLEKRIEILCEITKKVNKNRNKLIDCFKQFEYIDFFYHDKATAKNIIVT